MREAFFHEGGSPALMVEGGKAGVGKASNFVEVAAVRVLEGFAEVPGGHRGVTGDSGGEVVAGGFEVVAGGDGVDEFPACGVGAREALAGEEDSLSGGESDEVNEGLAAGVSVPEAEAGGGADAVVLGDGPAVGALGLELSDIGARD